MNAVINYYNQYIQSKNSRKNSYFDIHKSSDLKRIYTSIIKMSKESPIYKFDSSESAYKYAIDIKEKSGDLRNTLTAVAEETNPDTVKRNRLVISSDPETISVECTDNSGNQAEVEEFTLEVQRLASPQINTGSFLPDGRLRLVPNEYSINIETNNLCYGYQFHIAHNDTNLSLQEKLAHMINKSQIGITANVLTEPARGHTSLQLISKAIGIPAKGSESTHFTVTEDSAPYTSGVAKYLGIESVTHYPENASYLLDGKLQSSSSNTILINNFLEATLKQPTIGKPVSIGFKTNLESITDTIHNLTEAYNSLLTLSISYHMNENKSSLLYNDIRSIAKQNHNSLDAIGLTVTENSRILIDNNLLNQALTEDVHDTILTLSDFSEALSNISNQIYFNPMNYVSKTIIMYPNPGKAFANPYITSMYSGMLFNGYC